MPNWLTSGLPPTAGTSDRKVGVLPRQIGAQERERVALVTEVQSVYDRSKVVTSCETSQVREAPGTAHRSTTLAALVTHAAGRRTLFA